MHEDRLINDATRETAGDGMDLQPAEQFLCWTTGRTKARSKYTESRAGDMARGLRALAEDPGSVPSIHMVAHSNL